MSILVIMMWIVFGYVFFGNPYIALAIWVGIYMAINIWANDVANSVWPAVGSWTISMKQALLIAALGNFFWAIIAWGDVVKTIKKWIIDISPMTSTFGNQAWEIFVLIMLSALLAAAFWLTLATYVNAPVSTTHSIVGWVMWAGIATLGLSAVSWWTMSAIAASWVISPVLGWVIAAGFLYWIKKTIIYKKNMEEAARKWVPFFVAIMAWAFTTYLILKGIKQLITVDFLSAAWTGFVLSVMTFFGVRAYLSTKTIIWNTRADVAKLFTIPLIFAVALLTFAHWANDVANAIWPVAAIYDTVMNWGISAKVDLPIWILALGGFGIAFWLSFFWARIIKTVWTEITEIDIIRAFTVALAASITVIIASQLGLPVSSTHIAIGWVFWVWLLREWLDRKAAWPKRQYVKRSLVKKIVAAWLITVPASALLAWSLFMVLKSFML